MIAIILAIIIAVHIYKAARASNRNGIAWASIAVGAYIGIQLLVGFVIGFWEENLYDRFSAVINIVGWILSLIAMLVISNHLGKIPDELPPDAPPEPPKFG